jgi:hypothetical protein
MRKAIAHASAKQLLQELSGTSYREDRPDPVLEAQSDRPTRAKLQGRARTLPPSWVYIGRGSDKFRLVGSTWGNPFAIGRDGDRDFCLEQYRRHLMASPSLLGRLHELRGRVLACHCSENEGCHADILIQAYVEKFEKHIEEADATSDEDEEGNVKPKWGEGWHGVGPPLSAGRGSRRRGLRDGGGRCSPGRWPPWRRRLPAAGEDLAKILDSVLDEALDKYGKDFETTLVSTLACARATEDPLRGMEIKARQAIEVYLEKEGYSRSGRLQHPGAAIDFELVAALAEHLGDPDAALAWSYGLGTRLGYRRRMPRTPAVFEKKSHWAAHVGNDVVGTEWSTNYSSAAKIEEKVADTFEEQAKQGMMVKVTYRQARELYGERLRVASLGAVGPEGDERVIHDGTHQVAVNNGIRVRDQDETPLHEDLAAVLGAEEKYESSKFFALSFDVSKAHRRIPIAPCDWGLQACSILPPHATPQDDSEVWLNMVGTYGMGSASYLWNRFGALLLRLVLSVVGHRGLRWLLRFADDYLMLVRSGAVARPLVMAILLVRALSVPLKWSKFRGGRQTGWVGCWIDLEGQTLGISDKRCDWAAGWCRRAAGQRSIEVQKFKEAVGRLAFAAGPMIFLRPFLGPLYAWGAAVGGQRVAEPPPLVVFVLEWLAAAFERKERVPYTLPTANLGELFRSDAKAEGRRIVLGGWELCGGEDPRRARWYAIELTEDDIPWAYSRGDPFKAISALEMLGTLLCLIIFNPKPQGHGRGTIALTASGDNRSNGFSLDRFASTKYPLCLVMMELAHQLATRGIELDIAWRPREENIEADALTNHDFSAFSPERRIHVDWKSVSFGVLGGLIAKAESYYGQLKELKQGLKGPPAKQQQGKAKKKRLRETEPW